jgi:hypothetical protein
VPHLIFKLIVLIFDLLRVVVASFGIAACCWHASSEAIARKAYLGKIGCQAKIELHGCVASRIARASSRREFFWACYRWYASSRAAQENLR